MPVALSSMLIKTPWLCYGMQALEEGKEGNCPCFSSLGTSTEWKEAASLSCISAIPQTHSFPFVSLQDNSLSHHTHPHPTFLAHHWLRTVILSINQSSKSLGDEPIKEKVVLSSFLSPPAPFPNSLFLIGTGLFSATVTTETFVTIATVYVKSVALYLLKRSIYTCCVWWAAQYQHTHTQRHKARVHTDQSC